MIQETLQHLRSRMCNAAKKVGRNPDDIKLAAVSKTQSIEAILKAYEAGQRIFAENMIQESQRKIPLLPKDINWHFIGHLQSNKAKYAVKMFDVIHSVDSINLALEIDKRGFQNQIVQKVMIEVNASGEKSKFGVSPEGIFSLAGKISKCPNLQLSGLMTIPPLDSHPESSRRHFRNLRMLSVELIRNGFIATDECELSMGMSNDFEIAIEEGATIVRIGAAIFGDRIYKDASA